MFRSLVSFLGASFLLVLSSSQTGPVINTVAGGGPDQLLLSETFLKPCSLLFDGSGDLFVVSRDLLRVFRIDSAGNVHPFLGSGGFFSTPNDKEESSSQTGLQPCGGAFDAAGNLFVSTSSHRVLMRDAATGTVTTFAGTTVETHTIDGAGGDSRDELGDGWQANRATLHYPAGLAFDTQGNLFIADTGNHRIRMVNRVSHVITTVAGNGARGFAGDGGQATSAMLSSPADLAFDSTGNLLIADTDNDAIRRVQMSTGIITTAAGTGLPGNPLDGVPATSSHLSCPTGVSINPQGDILIADTLHHSIRKVDRMTGIISTIAGTGLLAGSVDGEGGNPLDDRNDGGPATAAALKSPTQAILDPSGGILIAESPTTLVTLDSPCGLRIAQTGANQIRRLDTTTGTITTLDARSDWNRGDGHPATNAYLEYITGLVTDPDGNILIAGRHSVRRVDAISGLITTVAGCRFNCSNQPGATANNLQLGDSIGIALARNGDLLIADEIFHQVYRVDGDSSIVTVVAGHRDRNGSTGDGGPAKLAGVEAPKAVVTNDAGDIFILQSVGGRRGFVRRVDAATGIISTVAGGGNRYQDGISATEADILFAFGLAIDQKGNLFISTLHAIRRVDATTGLISTVADRASENASGTCRMNSVRGLAVDSRGDILFADEDSVCRLNLLTGRLQLVAGSGLDGFFGHGFSGDGGPALKARLNVPTVITVAGNGDLLIIDSCNFRIRRVSTGTP